MQKKKEKKMNAQLSQILHFSTRSFTDIIWIRPLHVWSAFFFHVTGGAVVTAASDIINLVIVRRRAGLGFLAASH